MRQYLAQKQRRQRNPTGLSYKQKRELASELIRAAGDLMEKLRDQSNPGLDRDAAAKQLALWLKDLPGQEWDERLAQREIDYSFLVAKTMDRRPGVRVDLKFP
jgi:hypothetical protein